MFRSDSGFFDFEHSDSEPMTNDVEPMSPAGTPPSRKAKRSNIQIKRPSIGEGLNHARFLLDRSPRIEPYARNGAPQCMKTGTLSSQFHSRGRDGSDANLATKYVSRLGRTSSTLSITARRASSSENLSAEQAAVVFPELPHFPKGLTILIVDEDLANLNTNAKLLREFGYEVTAHANAQEALDLLKRAACCFHVVLASPTAADVLLSNEVSKSVPMILSSNEMGLAAVAKSVMNGCIGFINNPLWPEDCEEIWRWVLEEKTATAKRGGSGSGEHHNMSEVLGHMQHLKTHGHSRGVVC
mmetsp:Transcript_4190/g.8632  ORF Transcript_4190/g.8632 Transcript_4190/m.8632 type:complete len:299 (-) Transcript_4190:581-1477(-)